MSLPVIKQNIITIEHGIILHGVNCQRAMGSGIALAIKNKWYIVYEEFVKRPKDKIKLGVVDIVHVDDRLWVLNCYTQEYYGRDGKRYASVDAIREALNTAFAFADYKGYPVHMPKIGCGLGGLDWETEVEPIVEELIKDYRVNVNIYEI